MAAYLFETLTAAQAASYDPGQDVLLFGAGARADEVVVLGADTIPFERRSAPSPQRPPDTSAAGLERLRQAELRRSRKIARQKKGMRHG